MNDKINATVQLEPRVAKLEVGLDRLTEDVRSLASIVRDQGNNIEKQLQGLTVAVTQAAGPRKTDWSTIFAGIALILAIGSAVFWPLNQKLDYAMGNLQTLQTRMENHEKMDMHPVGMTLVQKLEENLKTYIQSNEKEMMEFKVKLDNEQMKRADEDRTELRELKEKLLINSEGASKK